MTNAMDHFTFYFAGELFDSKHLIGNAFLAEEIFRQSEGRFVPILPQDLEQREASHHEIRDEDLLSLVDADLGLFHFDGTEMDSGTVVEFMAAKYADIPSVVVRSDFRKGGDQAGFPWNLMLSYYPRTEVLLLHAMEIYQSIPMEISSREDPVMTMESRACIHRSRKLLETMAGDIISAFEKVLRNKPTLHPEHAEVVYQWLSQLPGFSKGKAYAHSRIESALRRKVEKNLL